MVANINTILKDEFSNLNDPAILNSVAYLASLQLIHRIDPAVSQAVIQELIDQRSNLKMIASENFSSISV